MSDADLLRLRQALVDARDLFNGLKTQIAAARVHMDARRPPQADKAMDDHLDSCAAFAKSVDDVWLKVIDASRRPSSIET
jgi:hypothetical protein